MSMGFKFLTQTGPRSRTHIKIISSTVLHLKCIQLGLPPLPLRAPPPRPSLSEPLLPAVACSSVSPSTLQSLLGLAQDHRHRLSEQLARQGRGRGQESQQKEQEGEEEEIQSQFTDVVVAMETYLAEATAPIKDALR